MKAYNESVLNDAIYKKYIEPIKRKRRSCVGVEFELPIVNLTKHPVDFETVHKLTDAFVKHFDFDIIHRDSNGDIYSAQSSAVLDDISYDCSYNTLELSFGTEEDLNTIHDRFVKYYSFIQDFLAPYQHTLTGMGINPYHQYNRSEPVPNGRYRMLLRHLSSYKKYGDAIPFHDNPDFGLFSCSTQVQLDVDEDTAVETLNTFSKLEPLKSLILTNSLWGEHNETLCARDNFWKNSLHGLNRHNVDMYDIEFRTIDDIVEYIKTMSLYCVERDDKYINFVPTPLREYFAAQQITGEYFDGEGYSEISFEPRIEDLEYLRSFKFEDLTYRGTVEFRSVCEQPVSEIMCSAALHTGLMKNLYKLTELLDNDTVIYHKGYSASELREIFNRRELPDFFNRDELSALLMQVLDIAHNGLVKRGLGEERFLEPLYHRAKHLYSPARQMADGLDAGVTLEQYIKDYAKL